MMTMFAITVLLLLLSRPAFQLRRLAWVLLLQGSFQAGGQGCVQDSKVSVVLWVQVHQ